MDEDGKEGDNKMINYPVVASIYYTNQTGFRERLEAGASTELDATTAILAKALATCGTVASELEIIEYSYVSIPPVVLVMGSGPSKPAEVVLTKTNLPDLTIERKTVFFPYMPVSNLVAGTEGDISPTNGDLTTFASTYIDGYGVGGYTVEQAYFVA